MAFAEFIRNRAAISISLLVMPLVAFLALPSVAQDPKFDWSWEKADAAADPAPKPDEESSADVPAEPGGENSDFDWSWKEGDGPAKRPPASKSDRVRDDEAYQKLLTENLGLRREIAEAMKDEEVAKKESVRLMAEIKDMEKNLSESVQVIKSLKSSHSGTMSPAQINELEVRLAKADRAKEAMASELHRLESLRDGAAQDLKSATAGVTAQSDLFRDKEEENALLKKRLVEIETARRKLASSSAKLEKETSKAKKETSKARKEAQQAKDELKQISEKALAVAKQGAQYKKMVETLPEIEKQVSALKMDSARKDEKLSMRAQQLAALKIELDRREHRLSKQQKMTELLERARAEVMQVNNREKLDMHYNMAVIYAKEGRVRDAEDEYLKALRLDPTDADIHYNLGILYDQDLKKTRKAAMHYRRYITLSPSSTDVDEVKSWILDLDMAK
jgi:tetratricopeptide (TPR) repeat protein